MLFLGILAGSLLFGVALWKLGQRKPTEAAEGESHIGQTIVALGLCLFAILQAYNQWTDLGSAIGHLHRASPADLHGYLADAELARRRLVLYVIGSTVAIGLFASQANKLTKAFMRRSSEKAAKLQETNA